MKQEKPRKMQHEKPAQQYVFSGLYIIEFSPFPVGEGKKSKGSEMWKKIKGEKREKKKIGGKYNFWQVLNNKY